MGDHKTGLSVALYAVLALVGANVCSQASAQTIEIAGSTRSGAPIVRLSGFPPRADVHVSYTRPTPGPAYRSSATYRTNQQGVVELSTSPVAGDWKTPFPEAPYWTMKADPAASMPRDGVVLLQARSGVISAQAEYPLPVEPAATIEPVATFPGAFLARPTGASGPLPLIIVLGGSEADDLTARLIAPRLAAAGFAALGLPYRSPLREGRQAIPGLPTVFSEIPVDQLEQVHAWARNDRRVDARRIGLWGFSKGAELALIAASNYDWIDAVAAISPSDVVWEGFGSGTVERTGTPSFSLKGRPMAFVPYGAPGRLRDAKEIGRWQNPDRAAAARIPVENYGGRLLVAGGAKDRSWDSAGMAQSIAERRSEAGRSTVSLIFPDANHLLTAPALVPVELGTAGGTVEGNGQARLEIWDATVRLFQDAWRR